MAREECLVKCPKIPDIPEDNVDMLFVGHSYGEKPLLADDELDTEEDNPSSPPPPLLIDILDETPSKDVFALAPFQKPEIKKKIKRELNSTPDSLLQLSTPSPPILVAISPVIEGALVDLDDVPSEDTKDSGFNTFSNDYDSNKSFPTYLSDCKEQEPNDNKDLFGSSPFNSQHRNNPFIGNSEIITTNDGLFHRTSIIIGSNESKPNLKKETPQFGFNTIPRNSVSNVFISPTMASGFVSHDLFGSIPFDKLPPSDAILTKQFPQRPTSLAVNSENILSQLSNHLASGVELPGDSSSPEALILPNESDDNNLKLKKDHKTLSLSDKCKYHLIEESKTTILPVRHKSNKSSGSKKAVKMSKKVGKISTTGFSNMSFEDFPSDDADESLDQGSSVPFEVLRDEKTPVESERKFGSLKRRSNPFS